MSMDNFVKSLTTEQKKALFYALMNETKTEENVETNHTKSKTEEVIIQNKSGGTFIDENFKVHREEEKSNRLTVRGHGAESQFIDPGGARSEETAMPDIVNKIPPVSRSTRKPATKKEYICSVCNKKFKENPDLVYGEFHRCDSCQRRSR